MNVHTATVSGPALLLVFGDVSIRKLDNAASNVDIVNCRRADVATRQRR